MILSQVSKQLSWFWSLEWIECFDCVFGVFAFALVLNEKCRTLGWLEWWWLGGIYSPNHYSSRCCRWAHQIVRWCTGQGLFTVWCLPRQQTVGVWSSWLLKSFVLLLHRTCPVHSNFQLAHYSPFYCSRQSTVGASDRCSVGAPDMFGAHRTV
jgi:hypothetical protein